MEITIPQSCADTALNCPAVVQIWGLGFWRQEITLPLVMYEFRKNIERDFMVWENKAYNEYPLLTEADGEIFLKFRRYCQQFYP